MTKKKKKEKQGEQKKNKHNEQKNSESTIQMYKPQCLGQQTPFLWPYDSNGNCWAATWRGYSPHLGRCHHMLHSSPRIQSGDNKTLGFITSWPSRIFIQTYHFVLLVLTKELETFSSSFNESTGDFFLFFKERTEDVLSYYYSCQRNDNTIHIFNQYCAILLSSTYILWKLFMCFYALQEQMYKMVSDVYIFALSKYLIAGILIAIIKSLWIITLIEVTVFIS